MMGTSEPSRAICPREGKRLHRVNVHLWPAALTNDSRFVKQAQTILAADLAEEVILVGQSKRGEPLEEEMEQGVRLVRCRSRLTSLPKGKLFGCLKYGELICREVLMARRLRPSVLHCHSLSSLPAAALARAVGGMPMVYDARELETETNGLRGINQAFARRLERTFIPLCDAVLCVSDSIADWYAREYGICRPFVVRNVPAMQAQPTDAERRSLRERFRIPREALVFIYSGGLYKGRRIEQLLRAFQEARPNLHIVFMGFGPLEGMVRKASAASANIHFLPSIPPEEILSYTAGADIGVAAHLEPTCLNHRFALPNKFFEYLLAGVPVWVNDVHEEMAALVRRHGFGWVTRYDEGGVLEWVNGLSPGELQMKRELAAKASHCFSWEHEAKVFVTAYRQAMRGRDRSTSGPSWLL